MDDRLAEFVRMLQDQGESGAYLGRLNPMHLGHQALGEVLTTAFPTSHLMLVGSCSHLISIRHLFKFSDRYKFINTVFPNARIAPLADYESDDDWFHAIDVILRLAGLDPAKTVFIGGCDEDVHFLQSHGYKVQIINRFDGTTTNVSGTEIRDALIHGRSLDGLLDPKIIPLVQETFCVRWAEAVRR
ncbi:MAG: hypothetical protein KBD06_01435 [Candidatus Pacebacteria bacterium]|nr:hypothetical protein [Candidatus Paceibacterota bacterium]